MMGIEEFIQTSGFNLDKRYRELLSLLERVNPCMQDYHIQGETLIVTYVLRLDILNLWGKFPLRLKTNIVGMPVSISRPGYFGKKEDVEGFLQDKKGLWIVLNSEESFPTQGKTLSTFVFENRFEAFEEYLSSLRSPYRRRVKKTLSKRDLVRIEKCRFNQDHYELYQEVMKRSDHPLEILPIEFFTELNSQIYEFRSREGRLLAFVQTNMLDNRLMFLFCGFKQEDVLEYDLYFNMLLFLVDLGIHIGVDEIDFGQTSEESKLKIGCVERKRFLLVHHHNPIIRTLLGKLTPLFSYRSYPVGHRVFKEDYHADIS